MASHAHGAGKRGASLWLVLLALLLAPATGAQENRVIRDGSIGPLLDPLDPVPGEVPRDDVNRIWFIDSDLGARSANGANLFHSFQFFDVASPWRALFQATTGPTPQRVIARVTGGDRSDIDGVLESDIDGADLFLLNPSGIVFTANARLDLRGSFYGSTADVFGFGDQDFLTGDATPPVALSGLDPVHFGFRSATPQPIEVTRTGADLRGQPGETLALVGGDVTLNGTNSAIPVLRVDGGTVAIAAVASAGVDVPVDVASFAAAGLAPDALGNVVLRDRAGIAVNSGGGTGSGRLVIRGGRFEMRGGLLAASNNGALPGAARAVDIEVAGRNVMGSLEGVLITDAALFQVGSGAMPAGEVRVVGPRVEVSGAGTQILTAAAGSRGADIRIEAAEIRIVDSALVSPLNFSPGFRGGDVILDAGPGGSIAIESNARVVSDSSATGGRGGDLRVLDAVTLRIAGGELGSTANGSGVGGAIRVDVGALEVEAGQITSQARGQAAGGAVDVTVDGDLTASALGGIVSLATAGAGAGATGGDVTVRAGRVVVTGADTPAAAASQISAITDGPAPGGNLTVRSGAVVLAQGGQLRTTTNGGGDAGALVLEGPAGQRLAALSASGMATAAGEDVPSGVFARSFGDGNAGDIRIDADLVEVTNAAAISARGIGMGRGGSVLLENAERVVIGGGPDGVGEISTKGAAGGAGGLEIRTDVLEITGGGQASASTLGAGDAGNLRVQARDVRVSGQEGAVRSGIFAQTLFGTATSGDGGNIAMDVSERLAVEDGGRISVESRGGGFAGDIEIRGTEQVSVTSGGEISALVRNTRAPLPGENASADLLIEDVGRLLLDGGTLTAETLGTGQGGQISVRGVDTVVLTGGLVTARSEGDGAAGNVIIGADGARVGELVVSGGRISTETSDDGEGGDIEIRAVRQVLLRDGAAVTAESTGTRNAGSVAIDAGQRFMAVANSPLSAAAGGTGGVVSTKSDTTSGGTITIRASELIYLSDSRVETQVQVGGGDGGDFGTPALPGAAPVPATALVVLNRSRVVASAVDLDGGNILIEGTFLPSDALSFSETLAPPSDSVLDATSETGIPGEVLVTSPDAELAGQIVPLPTSYLDASKLMQTPCAARRSRAGSFTVQSQAALPPPDAPFAAAPPVPGAAGDGPEVCPSEEVTP